MTRRYLSANAGTEIPSNLLFISTTSTREPIQGTEHKHRDTLREWHAIGVVLRDGKATRRSEDIGTNPSEFWEVLWDRTQSRKPLWCFGEDIGRHLTLLGIWERLDNGRVTLQFGHSKPGNAKDDRRTADCGRLAIDGVPTYIVCRINGRTIKFVDTLNYWREGLRNDCPKLDGIRDAIQGNGCAGRDGPQSGPMSAVHVERAVCGLLLNWQCTGSGVFQLTAPALALTNYRHTSKLRVTGREEIDIVCQPGERQNELEREAYYGGRTTCYRVGPIRGPVYHLDVNSLYPYVMRNWPLPRRFVRFEHSPRISDLKSAASCYGVVARVKINSRVDTYPYRDEQSGTVSYCNGVFWTALCGSELKLAIFSGAVERCDLMQLYSVANLFREWVDYWYAKKTRAAQEGNTAEYEFAKLILNSLYGKWAQRGRRWIDRPDIIPPKRWGPWSERKEGETTWSNWRAIAGHSQQQVDGKEPRHSFPAVSAFITAAARRHMEFLISLCPEKSVYYMGVDSLICSERAYLALTDAGWVGSDKIGHMKICGIYPDAEVFGPNDYRLGAKRVCSGHHGNVIYHPDQLGRVELIEQLPSIIHDGPRSDITVTQARLLDRRPDLRGSIDSEGYWHPYRLSMEPEFSDRPRGKPVRLAY